MMTDVRGAKRIETKNTNEWMVEERPMLNTPNPHPYGSAGAPSAPERRWHQEIPR